jgi:hypothetical protein
LIFVVDKVATGQVSSTYFRFTPFIFIPPVLQVRVAAADASSPQHVTASLNMLDE